MHHGRLVVRVALDMKLVWLVTASFLSFFQGKVPENNDRED